MVDLALPERVFGAGARVGADLDELAAHLFGAGQLQFGTGLIHAGKHRPAGGYFKCVLVPAWVSDTGHVVGQSVNGSLYSCLVVESTAGYLQPGTVQRALKLAGHGVSRGGGQVSPGSQRLAVPGVQQVVEGFAAFNGRGFQLCRPVDRVVAGQRRERRVQQRLPDDFPAFAAVLCQ